MNWGRCIWEGKWVLSRWVTMLSLSSCSLISLGSHFPSSGDRWSSPSMRFQLEEQGRGFRRAKAGRCTVVSLAVASKGWSFTFPKGGLHQPLITSSSWSPGKMWVCWPKVLYSLHDTFCVGTDLPWLRRAGRAEGRAWMWQSGHHICKVLRHLSEHKHSTMC